MAMTELEKIHDQLAGKSLLTGTLLGLMMQAQAEGRLIGVLDVRPVIDDDGNYSPMIDVTMHSGTYRIGIVNEYTIDEEP